MAREQLKTLTEPMYYMLLALIEERHGYGIMQQISEMTEGRVQVGAGTLYALLSRFEGESIITQTRERERKKYYQLAPKGEEILAEEFRRLNQLVRDGQCFFDADGNLMPPRGGSGPGESEQEEVVEVAETQLPEGMLVQEADTPVGNESAEKEKKERSGARPGIGFGRGFRKGFALS